jgi:hypothetical protein
MKVVKIGKDVCSEFVLKKHYSHRVSIFWAGFALIENNMIEGVCVFGQPSPPLQKHAFKDRDFRLFELTRLVVQSKTKNASSFLIANSLKMLEPKPCAVVSFADSEQGHCGYVYQATNWVYTGATISHDHSYLVDGKRLHPITLRDMGITNPKEWAKKNGIKTIKPFKKHRYFFAVGDKKQKIEMLAKLKYPIIKEYPKMNPTRYDDGPIIKRAIFETEDRTSCAKSPAQNTMEICHTAPNSASPQ